MTLLLALLCALVPQDSDKDKLKQVEKETVKKTKRQEEPRPTEETKRSRSFDDDDDDDEDFLDVVFEAVATLVVEVILLPFRYGLSDQGLRYDDYPYASGSRKYFMHEADSMKGMGAEFDVRVGRIEDDLWSIGVDGTFRLASGCDINFDITRYEERTDDGDDRLTLHQYAFNFGARGEPPRTHQASFGVGLAIFQGEESDDAGPLFQVDFIHFPGRPFSLKYHVGVMLFSGATLTDLSLDVGVHFDRFAVTAGVRSLLSSDGEDLTGPTLGVALFI
jgi:hypothetical protein